MKEYYAHSIEGKPKSEWQGLEGASEGDGGTGKEFKSAFFVEKPVCKYYPFNKLEMAVRGMGMA